MGLRFILAPPARLELTTLRLGGARSIQVSYGGILAQFQVYIFYPKYCHLSRKSGTFFLTDSIYCYVAYRKGENAMRETNDPNADLEDLLFEPDAGGPSER